MRFPVRPTLPRSRPVIALLAVVAVYVVVQLVVVGVHGGLGWDEAIYASQFGRHAPPAWFDAPRARGVTLVSAPVVVFTSSLTALRLWLIAVSGVWLYAAFRAWISVRNDLVVPVAAAGFAALWVVEYYGAQIMPNYYVATGSIAAAAFVVRALRTGSRGPLAAAAANMAWVALVRPSDAAWVLAGFLAAVAIVVGRSRWRRGTAVASALVAGAIVGTAEWVVEAIVRFGSVAHRLHEASMQNATGLTFSLPTFARAVNGPLLCRPCHPAPNAWIEALWWLALPPLMTVAVIVGRRNGRLAESLVPAAGALAAWAQYVFFIRYAAPRFLMPGFGLAALPVAFGAAALTERVKRSDRTTRRVFASAAAVVVLTFLAEQLVVLVHQVHGRQIGDRSVAAVVALLRRAGVTPPCAVGGPVTFQIRYLAGCLSDYDAIADVTHRRGTDTAHEVEGDAAADRIRETAPDRYALALPVGRKAPAWFRGPAWRSVLVGDGAYRVYVRAR